jgi:hypothetical protein
VIAAAAAAQHTAKTYFFADTHRAAQKPSRKERAERALCALSSWNMGLKCGRTFKYPSGDADPPADRRQVVSAHRRDSIGGTNSAAPDNEPRDALTDGEHPDARPCESGSSSTAPGTEGEGMPSPQTARGVVPGAQPARDDATLNQLNVPDLRTL